MSLTKRLIKHFDLIRIISSVLIGFALAFVFLFFVSNNPFEAIKAFMLGPFESKRRFFNIIELMIPLIFTSLGMCFMLKVGSYNLIVEGGFMLSGAVVSYMASTLLPADLPKIIYPFILIIVGTIIGGLCGLLPAFLDVKWKTNVVVVTIMLNYILTYASTYILRYWMRDNNVTYLGSRNLAKNAQLSGIIKGTEMHTGVFIAILVVILAYVFFNKTKKGFEVNITGSNKQFAKYVGVNVTYVMLLSQIIGGALAGMGGAVEILGKYDRFLWVNQTGYGFDGLMIAVLALKNPVAVPIVAFLFAFLKIGANIVGATTDVPTEFVMVVQSIIILLVAATLFMDSIKKRLVAKASQEEMQDTIQQEAKEA